MKDLLVFLGIVFWAVLIVSLLKPFGDAQILCTEAGWPRHRVVKSVPYCIRSFGGTEYIVPAGEVGSFSVEDYR